MEEIKPNKSKGGGKEENAQERETKLVRRLFFLGRRIRGRTRG